MGRAVLLVLLLLGHAGHASADPPAFDLRLEGCEGIDADALSAKLELELLDVAPSLRELGGPPVLVRCAASTVHITIGDPATGKTVARAVPRPADAGAERAIALSVAELYIASWLELLIQPDSEPTSGSDSASEPEPEPEPESGSTSASASASDLRAAARARAQAALPRAAAGVAGSIGVEAGAGLRDPREPFAALGVGVRASLHPGGRWGLVLATRLERGEAERQRGSVIAWWGAVELGVALRALRRGAFRLGVDLRAGLLYARVEGRGVEGVRAEAHGAVGGRATLALRPALVLGRFRGGLALSVGVDLGAPTGLVSEEPPVTTGGFFASLGLDLAVLLGSEP